MSKRKTHKTTAGAQPSGASRTSSRKERARAQSARDRARPNLPPARTGRSAAEVLKNAYTWPVLVLLLIGFALRIFYLFEFQKSVLFEGLVLDEANYDHWAQAIAGGNILGEGVFTANPLGPYMLGMVYLIFGRSLWWARVLQMLVDTASCYFIYRITLHLFNRRAALVALALASFYGPMIFFAGNLVATVWVIFFVSASLMLITFPEQRVWRQILAGAFFALAMMGRPNLVLALPVIPFVVFLSAGKTSWERRVKRSIPWFVGAALILVPVSARNANAGGSFSPLPAHGGVNLWIGNNPDADGFFKTPRGSGLAGGQKSLVRSSVRVAEKAEHRNLTPSEASKWWRNRAFDFIEEHPIDASALMLRKLGYFFNSYEKPLETNYHYGKKLSAALRYLTIGFGLLCPLALIGLFWSRDRWSRLAVLWVYGFLYAGSVVITFVSMRYRLPVVVCLFPFAGFAAVELWERLKARDRRVLISSAAVVAVGFGVVHLPLARGEIPHDIAHTHFMLGNLAQDKGDWETALKHHQTAVELYPEWGGYYNNLGLAYLKVNQPEKAIEVLKKAIEMDRGSRRVYRNLAKGYRALGQYEDAAKAYRNALEHSPRHIATHVDLARMLIKLGKFEEARAEYEKALGLTKNPKKQGAIRSQLARLDEIVARGRDNDTEDSAPDEGDEADTDTGEKNK